LRKRVDVVLIVVLQLMRRQMKLRVKTMKQMLWMTKTKMKMQIKLWFPAQTFHQSAPKTMVLKQKERENDSKRGELLEQEVLVMQLLNLMTLTKRQTMTMTKRKLTSARTRMGALNSIQNRRLRCRNLQTRQKRMSSMRLSKTKRWM